MRSSRIPLWTCKARQKDKDGACIPLESLVLESPQPTAFKVDVEKGTEARSDPPMVVFEDLLQRDVVENKGSTARDYCAMERTYLSHIRFGLVLLLLSSSLLLRARLPPPQSESEEHKEVGNLLSVALGSVYFVASMLVITMGWIWYEHGLRGLRRDLGFIGELKVHEFTLGAVALLIFGTCVMLLVDNNNLL
ncbi:hypothetical protein FRC03_000044 [Tulasnella sp. 419]|nr:hypothetical protein FRC03_000044 [Tulasnella sp. 419]